MLTDIGEHIPNSKKELAESTDFQNNTGVIVAKLTDVWPEPNWQELSGDSVEPEYLATLYSVYHSLSTRSHGDKLCSICNASQTPELWEKYYVETVTFIKEYCERDRAPDFEKRLKQEYTKKYPKDNYQHYAPAKRFGRTVFGPFSKNLKEYHFRNVLPYLHFPGLVDPMKIPAFPIEVEDSSNGELYYQLLKVNPKSYSSVFDPTRQTYKNRFPSYVKAVLALVEHHGTTFKVQAKKELYTPHKDLSEIDESYFPKVDIEPELLISEIGMRGVQYGSYLTQKERQQFVNNTYYSFKELARQLGVPPVWIGGRTLGMAFAARGSGSAMAHYESDDHVINLTRKRGPGSLSHEWLHSLDRRLYVKWFGQNGSVALLSESMNYVSVNQQQPHYRQFKAFESIYLACTEASGFVENARRIGGQSGARKYWDKKCELLARAFEAFIQDKMSAEGIPANWLVTGTRVNDYPDNGMHPYPCGAERERINQVIEEQLPILFGLR